MKKVIAGLGGVDYEKVSHIITDEFEYIDNPDESQLSRVDGALVRANYKIDAEALGKLSNVQVLARTGVGYDLVDVQKCSDREIAVAITPGSNSVAVAEGTFAHLLSIIKQIGPYSQMVAEDQWSERNSLLVDDLEQNTLGILGYGRIGKKVAEIAKAFSMRVYAYDPYAEIPAEIKLESVEEIFSKCKYISLHLPLNEQTRNIIDAEAISQMPAGAVVINCGRGGLVDLDAASVALQSGHLAGVGLDVFEPEPPKHHPIFDHPNVTLTPHMMGLSVRAMQQTFEMAAEEVVRVLRGQRAVNCVNPEIYN